jgi:hypothetical protein
LAQNTKKPQVAGIDDLYGLPLAEFTPARNALAKRLRGDGEREAADEAGSTRKPTASAWVVNQLVRRKGKQIEDLLSLGGELREAQAGLVAKGDAGDVLALSERERGLVEDLVEKGSGILEASGGRASEATREEVRETLHAAALDEEAAAAVAGGRLVKERRAIGLGLGAGGAAPPWKRSREKAPTPARVVNAKRRLEEARVAAREARQAADAAERSLRRVEGEARRAARAAEQASERERKATEALERAKR